MATHVGNTTDEFEKNRKRLDRRRTASKQKETLYRPGISACAGASGFFEDNDFKTFIVSGGGIEFMRPWVEDAYGIPKDQVVGSSIQTEYQYNDGNPVIERLAKIDLIDDRKVIYPFEYSNS
jgi:hypothetical protein